MHLRMHLTYANHMTRNTMDVTGLFLEQVYSEERWNRKETAIALLYKVQWIGETGRTSRNIVLVASARSDVA